MKTFINNSGKCLPVLFLLLIISSTHATARNGSEKLKAPDKIVECLPIDNFVAQCFVMYDSIYTIHSNLALVESQIATMKPSEIEGILMQLNQTNTNVTSMLPRIQSLLDAGASIPDHVKEVPILKIARALKNIKLAVQAIGYSLAEAKNTLSLIPGLRQKLPANNSQTGTDSTAINAGTSL